MTTAIEILNEERDRLIGDIDSAHVTIGLTKTRLAGMESSLASAKKALAGIEKAMKFVDPTWAAILTSASKPVGDE